MCNFDDLSRNVTNLINSYKTKISTYEKKINELNEQIIQLTKENEQLREANKNALATIEDAERVMASIDEEKTNLQKREENRVASVDVDGKINFADTNYGKLFFSKFCKVTAVEEGVLNNFNELAEIKEAYDRIISYIEKHNPEILSEYMKEYQHSLNKKYIEWCDSLNHPIDLETLKPILIETFYKNCEKYDMFPDKITDIEIAVSSNNVIPNGSSVSIDSENNPPVYRVIDFKNNIYTVRHANLSADIKEVSKDKVFLYRFQEASISK